MRVARVKLFKDRKGEYRWRLVAKNGRIVADSGEGYSRRRDAERAADRFVELVRGEDLELVDEHGQVIAMAGKLSFP